MFCIFEPNGKDCSYSYWSQIRAEWTVELGYYDSFRVELDTDTGLISADTIESTCVVRE